MSRVRIGTLDRKITVQRATVTPDENYNTDIPSWSDLYPNLWANKQSKSGQESLEVDQEVAREVSVFTIHYKPLLETDLLLYNGKKYDILYLKEIGRRQYLEITAIAKDNED